MKSRKIVKKTPILKSYQPQRQGFGRKFKIMTYYKLYTSPIGKILLTTDGEYLTGLQFVSDADASKTSPNLTLKDNNVFNLTSKWLDIYFGGNQPNFTPKYKLNNLSNFSRLVIAEILAIPYGKTTTYGEIAKRVAAKLNIKNMSAQAVGGAAHRNPICIIIPCHRVIGSHNKLTGYGGGLDKKIALLNYEGHKLS